MIIIYILISIIGFIPFFIVLNKISKVKKMKQHGVKTTGIVRELSGNPGSSITTATIEYFLEDGQHYVQKKVNVAGMPYQIGQQLPLYYDRKDPYNMVFDSGKTFILLIILSLLLAAVCITACFLIDNSITNVALNIGAKG